MLAGYLTDVPLVEIVWYVHEERYRINHRDADYTVRIGLRHTAHIPATALIEAFVCQPSVMVQCLSFGRYFHSFLDTTETLLHYTSS